MILFTKFYKDAFLKNTKYNIFKNYTIYSKILKAKF